MRIYEINEKLEENLKKDFPDIMFKVDNEMLMYKEFLSRVFLEEKKTTIRYKKGFLRYPSSRHLPLFETSQDDKEMKRIKGTITLETITIKTISELTDEDAKIDGFKSKEELLEVLKKIYGGIGKEELVSIYYIGQL